MIWDLIACDIPIQFELCLASCTSVSAIYLWTISLFCLLEAGSSLESTDQAIAHPGVLEARHMCRGTLCDHEKSADSQSILQMMIEGS